MNNVVVAKVDDCKTEAAKTIILTRSIILMKYSATTYRNAPGASWIFPVALPIKYQCNYLVIGWWFAVVSDEQSAALCAPDTATQTFGIAVAGAVQLSRAHQLLYLCITKYLCQLYDHCIDGCVHGPSFSRCAIIAAINLGAKMLCAVTTPDLSMDWP